MPEFVQERLHLGQREQGRFLVGWLGQVHDQTYVRPDIVPAPVYPLALKFCHPCTALLALAWVEVGIEYGQIASVAVQDLVGLDIGVVDRDIFALMERDTIQGSGQSEHAPDDIFQLEVRTEHLSVDSMLFHLQLMGIISHVPRLQYKVVAL